MTQILFFGDSIAYGAWDLEGGWPQRLRKFLDKKVIDSNYEEYFITYNLGIDGDTSQGLLKRFEMEAKPRISPQDETVFIFHIGDNDTLYNNKTKKFRVNVKDYEKNIKKIISQAKKHSDKILFIGSFNVDEEKTDPVPWVKDHSYKNEYLEHYREILEDVCKKSDCYYLPLSKHLDSSFIKFLPDGIHPNTLGYEITFDIIKKFLTDNKIL